MIFNQTEVRKIIKEARKDHYPASGRIQVSEEYMRALDREIRRVVRRHVKISGPARSRMDQDIVLLCS